MHVTQQRFGTHQEDVNSISSSINNALAVNSDCIKRLVICVEALALVLFSLLGKASYKM